MSAPKKIPRIVTFDILRGFFLIAIIINHLAFFPNLLDWWGMRGYLLVTTAEGFFLLSGIVLGVVRGAKLVDRPFKEVTKLVLHRAWTLYLTHIVLVIGFTLIAWYFYAGNPNIKFGIMEGHSWLELVWKTITMQYIYGWADYLRFYAIFIAASPLAFWLLRKGKWYVVLLISYLIWFLFPLDFRTVDWQIVELLQPIPWQAIFFTGLVIGFHWSDIAQWCTKHSKALKKYVIPPVIVTAVVLLLWNSFAVFAQEFVSAGWAHQLSYDAWSLRMNDFHKEQLPLQRFLLFLLWFWAAFIVVRHFEKPIIKYTGWLLIPFGTNSLYVYTLHAVIVFVVHLYVQTGSLLQNFITTIAVIGLIYLAIRTKFLMKIIPR